MTGSDDCVGREEFEAVVGELREELQREREEKRELRDRVEHLETIVEDRSEDGEDPTLGDVWLAGSPAGKLVSENNRRIKDLVKDDVERPNEPDEGEPDDPPIFDLLRTPQDRLEGTERRTAFLWRDLADYGTRTPKGLVLPASDVRRVLQAAEPDDGARIESKLVRRVFRLSETLTRDVVEVFKKDGEWRLVVPPDWKERAREAAPPEKRATGGGSDSAVS